MFFFLLRITSVVGNSLTLARYKHLVQITRDSLIMTRISNGKNGLLLYVNLCRFDSEENGGPSGALASDEALGLDNLSVIRHSLSKEIENLKTTAISWWDTYCARHWSFDSLSQLPINLLEHLAALHWVFFCEDVLGSLSPIQVLFFFYLFI